MPWLRLRGALSGEAILFALLIARHPEEIEHIRRDHRIAKEQRGSAGGKKLVHTPSDKSPG
jgi:hypothetical protein